MNNYTKFNREITLEILVLCWAVEIAEIAAESERAELLAQSCGYTFE